jgi:hypothetical protein
VKKDRAVDKSLLSTAAKYFLTSCSSCRAGILKIES